MGTQNNEKEEHLGRFKALLWLGFFVGIKAVELSMKEWEKEQRKQRRRERRFDYYVRTGK